TIRDISATSNTIAAAVIEQGAATQEIARSVEVAARRSSDTAGEVERVGEATNATRASASAVESVAGGLGTVATRIRAQGDPFFPKLRAARERRRALKAKRAFTNSPPPSPPSRLGFP